MFRKCFYLCILPLAVVYGYLPDQILYQEFGRNAFSHRVLVRQTQQSESRIITRQVQTRQPQVCQGPGGQRGRCVRLEDCAWREQVMRNRSYSCVIRNQGSMGVCCPDTVPTTSTPSEDRLVFEEQQQTTPNPNQIPQSNSGSLANNPEITPLGDFLVCGRNGKLISGITGARPTTVKDWPWMAALLYRRTFKQFCGGTVITRRHILTAAHCFPKADPTEVVVLLGDYDLKRPDESKSRAFSVVQMIIHEDFDVTTYDNDIAILVLNATTIYNSFIQPCCLPPPGRRYANTTAVVTGWGKLEFGGPSANLLMEVPVPVWDQARCVPNFAQTIFDSAMCAGAYEGGKDACQGDSGGPLVVQRPDNRWAIIGIVSWGIRCGEKDKPGIYTRVNDHLDWIAQTIL